MSAAHNHALPSTGNERALWAALLLTTAFLVAEVVAGELLELRLRGEDEHAATPGDAVEFTVGHRFDSVVKSRPGTWPGLE